VSVVLDCSVALSWFFEDERTPAAEAVLAQVAEQGAVAPGIWWLAVGDARQAAMRRGGSMPRFGTPRSAISPCSTS
jgi:hypothetical protein